MSLRPPACAAFGAGALRDWGGVAAAIGGPPQEGAAKGLG